MIPASLQSLPTDFSHDPEQGVSSTRSLHFSVYLAATDALPFLDCIKGHGSEVLFRFTDPENQIADLYRAYLRGAEAPALHMFQTYKVLRNEIACAQAEGK